MSRTEEPVEVARWYTPALRVPKLIGKIPSGERIPGGPYRPVQLGTAVAVMIVANATMGLWGGGNNQLVNYGICVAAGLGLGWLARYLPHGGTNPLVFISGGARVMARPTHGSWGRYAVTTANAVQVRSRARAHTLPATSSTPPATTPAEAAAAKAPTTPTTPPQPVAPSATAVDDKLAALLARR